MIPSFLLSLRKMSVCVIKAIKDDTGLHSVAILQLNPLPTLTLGMTLLGVTLCSATCYAIVADLRLICKYVDSNVHTHCAGGN